MRFSILSLSHQQLSMSALAECQISPVDLVQKLEKLKRHFGFLELMCLNTCNRVSFFLVSSQNFSQVSEFFNQIYPHLTWENYQPKIQFFQNEEALQHIFHLAASLESMVIGEREILTQLRTAFEWAQKHKFAKHYLRIIVREAISTAKQIFLQTDLGKKSVSVSSIAYHSISSLIKPKDQVLAIGAGITQRGLLKFFGRAKHPNIKIYNRTVSKVETFANSINAQCFALNELEQHQSSADILLICTGVQWLTQEKYAQIFINKPKIIVDLGLPADVDPKILQNYQGLYIGMPQIQEKMNQNLSERSQSIPLAEQLIEEGIKKTLDFLQERLKIEQFSFLPELFRQSREKKWHFNYLKELEHLDRDMQVTIQNMFLDLEKNYLQLVMELAKHQK